MRPAKIGDQGTLAAVERHGGITALVLQISENEQVCLYGEWRCAADLVQAFGGERVEIIEGEGSAHGFHDIRQVE